MIRSRILDEARSWVGVRWRHQGRDRTHGIDCVGLVLVVGWSLKLIPPDDHTGYQRGTHGIRFQRAFEVGGMAAVPLDQIRYGDVLVLAEQCYPCHIAVLARNTIIHAHIRHRKVVEEPYTEDWRGKIIGCYAYPGVD